ncbi:LysE family translocator [Caminibacter sp.]
MNLDYVFLFLSLMFPLVFSPGPANIVFAMSSIKQGFKKSIPLLLGINLLFFVYSIIFGFSLAAFFHKFPYLIKVIQTLGAFYIFYLSYKFLKDKSSLDSENLSKTEKTFTFKDGVILQLLNPKGATMLILMYSVLLDGSFDRNLQIISLVNLQF